MAGLNIPVPPVSLHNVIPQGPGISSSSFRGHAVVVNFWASWCAPCQAETPTLQAVHREFGNKVIFVGIDERDSRPEAITFLRSKGITYESGFDGDGKAGSAFDILGTPTTYFISHGREVDYYIGPISKTNLIANIEKYFGVVMKSP